MGKKQSRSILVPAPYDKTKMAAAFAISVGHIRRQWDALHYLFRVPATKQSLIKITPALSDIIATSLTVTVYILITQLYDPPISMKDPTKRNLVLQRVLDELAPAKGTPERAKIDAEFERVKPTFDKLKIWRNCVGAHKDLTTAIGIVDHILGARTNPIPRIPLADVEETVKWLISLKDVVAANHCPRLVLEVGDISGEADRLARIAASAPL